MRKLVNSSYRSADVIEKTCRAVPIILLIGMIIVNTSDRLKFLQSSEFAGYRRYFARVMLVTPASKIFKEYFRC